MSLIYEKPVFSNFYSSNEGNHSTKVRWNNPNQSEKNYIVNSRSEG